MARRAAAAQATVLRHVLPQYYHRVVPLRAYVQACAPDVLDAVAQCDAARALLDGLVGLVADAPPVDGDGLARVEAEGGAWPLLAVRGATDRRRCSTRSASSSMRAAPTS